jgi:cardiolipin synthase
LKPADIPNAICILRMLIVVPTLAALAGERYGLALTLVFIAGFSDALDGFLAKRFDWRSRLGGLLDPLADKFLLVSLFLALALLGLLPAWLAAVTVGRDIVIVAGGLAYNYLVGPVQPEPSGASKLNTAAQLACVVSVLFQKSFDWRIEPLITAVGAAVFVTSVVSGLDYVIRWSIRALQARA